MDLAALRSQALKEYKGASSGEELEALRVKYLGRKGIVADLFSQLPKLQGEDRASRGQELNKFKNDIEEALRQRSNEIESERLAKLAQDERLDTTLPGTRPPEGHLHITTSAIEEITRIFAQLGFYRVHHPEVDWDYYAFESLNMPKGHPARDEWETFFVDTPVHTKMGKMVLTPHTSNGQVREMERHKPPIRMINISKCYRRQSDVSHSPMFHQFEGLMIDRNVSVTHLKGTFEYFTHSFFGPDRKVRLRPFHFRFTEPSVEVDVSCGVCHGTGDIGGARCRLCKSGWVELAGGGMVHPNVLKAGGLDPKEWSGFAFGFGVERSYMMKAGIKIPDLRLLYNTDLSFLEQF